MLLCFALLTTVALAIDVKTGPFTENVTESLLGRFQYYASHAAATYCKPNNDSPGKVLTCYINETKQTSCSTLHNNANLQTLWEFEDIEPGDTTGYLAVDHARKELILAFRGSQSKSNWRTNKKFTLTDWEDLCPGCRVHRGFFEAFTTVKNRMITELKAARRKYPSYGLTVTGHSLGGALATVTATALRSEADLAAFKKNITLYTFGAPKVGNPALIAKIQGDGNRNYRVTKGSDPVPHVPIDFGTRWHYKQYFPNYHIRPDALNGVVGVDDIKVCMTSRACHVFWNLQKWKPHAWYFLDNRLSACRPQQPDRSGEKGYVSKHDGKKDSGEDGLTFEENMKDLGDLPSE